MTLKDLFGFIGGESSYAVSKMIIMKCSYRTSAKSLFFLFITNHSRSFPNDYACQIHMHTIAMYTCVFFSVNDDDVSREMWHQKICRFLSHLFSLLPRYINVCVWMCFIRTHSEHEAWFQNLNLHVMMISLGVFFV